MPFGNLGLPEVLIILVIILLLFGAKRIPEIAASMGKGINEFKRNLSDAQRAIQEPPRPAERIAPAAPAAEAVKAGEEEPAREPRRLMS
jgi:sec-independent protein translocase protein TatA